jgi:hypothetical protein
MEDGTRSTQAAGSKTAALLALAVIVLILLSAED